MVGSSILMVRLVLMAAVIFAAGAVAVAVRAQTPPTTAEAEAFTGLHGASHAGRVDEISALIGSGADLEAKDPRGRTPLHVAAYASHEDAVRVLARAGADLNALEGQDYDIVTIAAVANDLPMLRLALELGAKPGNITSPYEGTALITAAHLGHHEVVGILIAAGAPLDHVNNLGWTALIEAVVLGAGGPAHVRTAEHLVAAGADRTIADRHGVTPLEHARRRGYRAMLGVLERK